MLFKDFGGATILSYVSVGIVVIHNVIVWNCIVIHKVSDCSKAKHIHEHLRLCTFAHRDGIMDENIM